MAKIRIAWRSGEVIADLKDTPTAKKLVAALPFGPTLISKGNECRLVSKCNLLGNIVGDPMQLKSVRDGDEIRIEAV
jgi:hypothetical protein